MNKLIVTIGLILAVGGLLFSVVPYAAVTGQAITDPALAQEKASGQFRVILALVVAVLGIVLTRIGWRQH